MDRRIAALMLLSILILPGVSGASVLFDHTKSEDAGNADWIITGAYSDWADDLRALGYTVEELSPGEAITYGDPSNPKDLSHYDVFILPEPQNPFTEQEKNAILQFIQNGGALIYIADHKSSDRDSDGWDSWNIWNENLNFDSLFGITLLSTQIPSETVITDVEPVENLTDGVSSFGIWLGTAISVTGDAKVAAWWDRDQGMAAWVYTFYGNGKVIVFADSSTFSDGTCKTSCSGYDDYSKYDDSKVAINMVKFGISGTSGSNNSSQNNQSPTSPTVVINEIMYNPDQVDDSVGEWVEIYNPNDFDVVLSGWWLGDDEGGGYTFPDGATLPAHGYAVVARDDTWVKTHYLSDTNFDATAVYGNATFQLSNSADDIILKDNQGNVVDWVSYSDTWGADGNGKTLERVDPLGDSNSSTNWKESTKDGGTPTSRNTVYVPFFDNFAFVVALMMILALLLGRNGP